MKNRPAVAVLTAWIGLSHSLAAQPEDLRFEVASIKSAAAGARMGGTRIPPGRVRYVGSAVPLVTLIIVAYGVRYWQIEGGPAWRDTQYFDVDAKAAGPSTSDEFHVMLRNLLQERFQLVTRREIKESPILEMHIDKGGVKMTERSPPDPKTGPVMNPVSKDGKLGIEGSNVSMDDLAIYFSATFGQMVVDKTGLSGRYNLTLLNSGAASGPGTDLVDQLLFEDIPAQLGLRMVTSKGPVEHLVIEHLEKPSDN